MFTVSNCLKLNTVCRVRARWASLAACLSLAITVGGLCAQPASVGWVVDVKSKNWHVNGDKTSLAKGAYLPPEGMLSNSAPSDGDFLVVANMHGDIIRRLRCSSSACGLCILNDTCMNPIAPLPKAPEEGGYFSAAIGGLKDLFGEHPERYSVHRSRAIGHSCVSEAIASLSADGKARLDGLLKNCDQGTYTLEFRAAGSSKENSLGERPKQITVEWSPSSTETQFPLDLHPGLYRVEYTRDWMSGTAWLLLSSQNTYGKSSESFNSFGATIDKWGDDVEPETKAAYKRAFLDHLYQASASQ